MPARKPTALKLIKGTAQPCRMNPAEPKPKRGRPTCPPGRSAEFRRIWRAWIRTLEAQGILTVADGPALTGLVDSEIARDRARECLDALGGDLVYVTRNGAGGEMIRRRPELEIFDAADRRWRQWLIAFGQTPADRSRVSTNTKQPGNSFEEF